MKLACEGSDRKGTVLSDSVSFLFLWKKYGQNKIHQHIHPEWQLCRTTWSHGKTVVHLSDLQWSTRHCLNLWVVPKTHVIRDMNRKRHDSKDSQTLRGSMKNCILQMTDTDCQVWKTPNRFSEHEKVNWKEYLRCASRSQEVPCKYGYLQGACKGLARVYPNPPITYTYT